jgi:hypothetical protein
LLAEAYQNYCRYHKMPYISISGSGRRRRVSIRLWGGPRLTEQGQKLVAAAIDSGNNGKHPFISEKGVTASVLAPNAIDVAWDLAKVMRLPGSIARKSHNRADREGKIAARFSRLVGNDIKAQVHGEEPAGIVPDVIPPAAMSQQSRRPPARTEILRFPNA